MSKHSKQGIVSELLNGYGVNLKTLAASLLTFALMTTSAWAEFTAQVDTQNVALDDTFTLTLTSTDDNPSIPDLNPLEAQFQILSLSQSTATYILNGQVSTKNSWVVSLSPKTTGQVTIPPLWLGNERTAPITLNVFESGQMPSSTNRQNEQAITVIASVPDSNHYIFQEIPLTLRIETTKSLRQVGIDFSDIAGLEIEQQGQDHILQTTRNGLPVTVIEREYTLSPQQTGEFTIPPIVVQGEFIGGHGLTGRYGFDNFFNQLDPMFDQGKAFVAKSDPITLEIKANPNGQDEWFLPAKAVNLTGEWQPPNPVFKEGEAVTREITLLALGAKPEQLPKLEIAEVEGLQIYKDSDITDEVMTNNGLVAMRKITLSIIPEHGGNFTLPEMTVNWQNTVTDTAETAVLPSETINVEGVSIDADDSQVQTSTNANNITDDGLQTIGNEQRAGALLRFFGWLMAVMALVILGGVIYRRCTTIKNNDNADISDGTSERTNPSKEDTATNKVIFAQTRLKEALVLQDIKEIYQALRAYKQVNEKTGNRLELENINRCLLNLETLLFSTDASLKPANNQESIKGIVKEVEKILSYKNNTNNVSNVSNQELPRLYPS